MVPFSLFIALRLIVAVLGGNFGSAATAHDVPGEIAQGPEAPSRAATVQELEPAEGEFGKDPGCVVGAGQLATFEGRGIRVPGFTSSEGEAGYFGATLRTSLWRLGAPIRAPPPANAALDEG